MVLVTRARPWAILFTISVLAGLLAGCTGGEARSPLVAWDSLGVQILEIDRDRAPTEWGFDPEPEWVIGEEGSDSPELMLHQVVDARLLGEAGLVIAEAGSQRVIHVDLASGTARDWGGRGDGPDEFRGIERLFGRGGRQVGVFDVSRRRFAEFELTGSRVVDWRIPDSGPAGSYPLLTMGSSHAGEPVYYVLWVSGFPTEQVNGPFRGSGPLVRFTDPNQVDTLTFLPGHTTFVGEGASGFVSFGATSVIAGVGSGVWVGDTDHPEVKLWGHASEVDRIVRWTSSNDRTVTPERKAEFWSRLEIGLPPEERAMLEAMRDVIQIAEREPAFGDLKVSSTGTLWIGAFLPPEFWMLEEPPPPQEWLVVEEGWGEVRRLTTPPGLRVLQVEDEFFVGVHVDALGAETLRKYSLNRD